MLLPLLKCNVLGLHFSKLYIHLATLLCISVWLLSLLDTRSLLGIRATTKSNGADWIAGPSKMTVSMYEERGYS